jgi:hypothetical protein
MKWNRRILASAAALAVLLAGCGSQGETQTAPEQTGTAQTDSPTTTLAKIDPAHWSYNQEDGVYWQVQVSYCENPADLQYETLGIFVPAAYMDATDNGDGTYTCTVNQDAVVGGYTASDAPIVIPVNTPGYAAMVAPTDYVSDAVSYTDAGFIYVNAGCRGRDAGAPAGVTDLKAAVRYIRYNGDEIPGSSERIFTFGMSGGGAQSALVGATGDSELYTPYLEAIGAVSGYSDAVAGSMCWCPITNLDYADEAYEWNLGSTRTDLDADTQALSDGMAEAFAEYINALALTDEQGNVLALTQSENGIYQAGSYYEYVKAEIERSLNNFLADTTFPYTSGGTESLDGAIGGHGMGGMRDLGDGADVPDEIKNAIANGELQGGLDGEVPDGIVKGGRGGKLQGGDVTGGYTDANGQFQDDGIDRIDTGKSQTESKTYETAQEYIDELNADGVWVTYDSAANTAAITSVEDFVAHCKNASKSVGAFDDLDATQGENTLFGYGDGSGAHFDPVMAELLAGTEYGDAYAADLTRTDAQGNTVDVRVDMYNPLYFLDDYYEGYQSSTVATYWRIRTGIDQGDTALTTEINLALALENYGDTQVDFETVWGQGHTMAERTGNSTDNFIQWVNECLQDA